MSDEQIKAGEFRVALWGFKKSDVLAYIDVLAAENLQREAEHNARAEELQASIDALSSDKETLLVKTKEICQQLTNQEKRTNEAEAEAQQLQTRLTHLLETTEGYKNRLFSQEQELVSLRTENSQISDLLEEGRTQAVQAAEKAQAQDDLCRELQEKLDCEIAKAQQAAQRADAQEARCHTLEQNLRKNAGEAAQRLNEVRVQAQAEVQKARQQSLGNAQKLAEGMQSVQAQVAQVESRLAQTVQQLNETADSLYAALHEAQQSLRQMDAQLKGTAEAGTASNPRQGTRAAYHRTEPQHTAMGAAKQNKRSLADNLLERMARLLLDE